MYKLPILVNGSQIKKSGKAEFLWCKLDTQMILNRLELWQNKLEQSQLCYKIGILLLKLF